MTRELDGCKIIVPETRELALLVAMLEERGAKAIPCPLIGIHDAPEAPPVEAWIGRFNAACDDLILMTGEGLRRLAGFARRAGLEAGFVSRLRAVRKITRGPKPVKALRELGLGSDMIASSPTTDGIIASLATQELRGRRVGVQLYPDADHGKLLGFLADKGAAADPVLPYVYGPEAEDGDVLKLIADMAAGHVDAIAFTSSPQVKRMAAVAHAAGRDDELKQAFARATVAAVGPVVAAEVAALGTEAQVVMPAAPYSLKPLVRALGEALARKVKKEARQ
jgi:uroporphyrinogen-III synthase